MQRSQEIKFPHKSLALFRIEPAGRPAISSPPFTGFASFMALQVRLRGVGLL